MPAKPWEALKLEAGSPKALKPDIDPEIINEASIGSSSPTKGLTTCQNKKRGHATPRLPKTPKLLKQP